MDSQNYTFLKNLIIFVTNQSNFKKKMKNIIIKSKQLF